MVHKKSQKKREEHAARKYAYDNSISANRLNDPNEVRERIFTGSTQALTEAVLAYVGENRTGPIPEFETGLVISDSRGTGYFDVNVL
jgi:hypothetical protein